MSDERGRRYRLEMFELQNQILELEDVFSSPARWPWRGVEIGFPILSEHLDGMRDRLYLLASSTRMGKSTFALQLAYSILMADENARILFLSLQQPARDVNLRLVAMAGEVNLEYLVNPRKDLEGRYDDAKYEGLRRVAALKERLWVVDESMGALALHDLEGFLDELRVERGFDGPLFVVLDPLERLRGGGEAELAREIKTMTTRYRAGMVVTCGLASAAGARRPEFEDLDPHAPVVYESDVVFLLYCDFFNNAQTHFLEWEWGTDDLMVPIFELEIVKNRMGAFTGRLYYRFYNSFCKFKECSAPEMENYDRMLYNLRVHDPNDSLVDERIVTRYENLDAGDDSR